MSAQLQVIGPRNGSSPLTYRVAEPGTLDLQSAYAEFNGAGASGAWKAALTVRAQDGSILTRVHPTQELAVGDTADVTFAPFLGEDGGDDGGSGIQFDLSPQVGGFLEVTTTSGTPGMAFEDESGNGIYINSEDMSGNGFLGLTTGEFGTISMTSGDVTIFAGDTLDLISDDGINITPTGNLTANSLGDVQIQAGTAPGGDRCRLLLTRGTDAVLSSQAGQVGLEAFTSVYAFLANAGATLDVIDSGGNPIFRVDEDGNLHGKTGKALTFDL